MRKYWYLLWITLEQYFVYRLNFLLWRLRVVLNILLIYFLWSTLFLENRQLFGYTKEMMLTYILLMSFLSDLIFSSKIHEISVEIMHGDIINRILKPLSFFSFIITKELADKLVNVTFSLIEIFLLILILNPPLVLPHSLDAFIVALIFILIGIILSFFVSWSISMIAFWSSEIWAPRFIYFMMVFMLAGNYFPLDILPELLYNILLFTPFPYFIFIPAQIYLKGIPSITPVYLVMGTFWIMIFYTISQYLWHKGMKEYSFYGK